MQDFTIGRTGDCPLKFTGRLLASADGSAVAGVEQNRWFEIGVYETKAGQYVLEIAHNTRWQGESDYSMAAVCSSPTDVVSELKAFDPSMGLDPAINYPGDWATRDSDAGRRELDRHARKIEQIIRRFRSVVSDVLEQLDGFVEHVD